MPPRQNNAAQKLTYKPSQKLEVFYTGGSARITRDGKLLVCTCGEEIKVLDVATGTVVRTFEGDSEAITAIALSPDCETLVAASRSLSVRVYNLNTGELQRTWRAHKSPIADLAMDSSGGYVATASSDRTVKVWDVQGGFCTHSFIGHTGVVMKVLFHPKQLMLFTAGDDNEVRVWDLVDKSCTAVLKGHFSAVTTLALSPDGWLLLSGARDKVVIVWDIRNNSKVATIPVYESVEGLVSLPIGAPFPGLESHDSSAAKGAAKKVVFFATAGDKGQIKLWRSDTGTCVYTQKLAAGTVASASNEYSDLSLLPGGGGLLVSTSDARLLFYSAEGSSGAKRHLALTKELVGNIDEVTDVRFVGPREEPTDLAVANNSEIIRLFDLASLSCTASLTGHKDIVLCMDTAHLSTGRNLLLSGGKDNEVRLWDCSTSACVAVGTGHVGAVSSVAISRKPARKFAVSAGADKLLKVWDLSPAVAQVSDESAVEGDAEKAAAAMKLRVIAAVSAHDKDINSVALAPNDSLVATGSQDRTAKLWRLPDLVHVMTLRGHKRGVWSVEFSTVDQLLLTASGDKTIKLWSVQDGTCLRTLEGHSATVLRASFVSAGTQILSCAADGLVKLWSASSGECANTFDHHSGKIWAMTTAGAGEKLMATGGNDSLVAIWSDCTEEDVEAAAVAEEELVVKEQALRNALMDEDYGEAARLAFDLKHPGRLLSVVQRAAASRCASKGGSGAGSDTSRLLQGLVSQLSTNDLKTALEYCREWNTNSRHCHAAQAMLQAILRFHSPKALSAIPGGRDLVSALLVYTQRHFSRMDRLLRSSFLMEYTLASMKVLDPEGDLGGEEVIGEEAASAVQLPYSAVSNGGPAPRFQVGDDLEDDFQAGSGDDDVGELDGDGNEDMAGEDDSDDEDGDEGDQEMGAAGKWSVEVAAVPRPALAAAGNWSDKEEGDDDDSLAEAEEEDPQEEAVNNAGDEDDRNNNDEEWAEPAPASARVDRDPQASVSAPAAAAPRPKSRTPASETGPSENGDGMPGWGDDDGDDDAGAWAGGDDDGDGEDVDMLQEGAASGPRRRKRAVRIGPVQVLKLMKTDEDDGPGSALKKLKPSATKSKAPASASDKGQAASDKSRTPEKGQSDTPAKGKTPNKTPGKVQLDASDKGMASSSDKGKATLMSTPGKTPMAPKGKGSKGRRSSDVGAAATPTQAGGKKNQAPEEAPATQPRTAAAGAMQATGNASATPATKAVALSHASVDGGGKGPKSGKKSKMGTPAAPATAPAKAAKAPASAVKLGKSRKSLGNE